MNSRLTLLAWLLFGAFVLMLGGAIYVGFNPPDGEPIKIMDALWAGSFVGFPLAGALVVSRLPRRPLGWILCIAPVLLMIGLALGEAAGTPSEGGAGFGPWLEWGGSISFVSGLGLLLFVPLLLPDGTLPSPRWRWVTRALTIAVSTWVLSAIFKPGRMEIGNGYSNPLGIEPLRSFFELAEALLGPVALTAVALGALSLIVRFRGSSGREREQLKWLALGGVSMVGCFLIVAFVEAVFGDLSDVVVTLIIIVGILALPASIAAAVMRHRLYDVDLIINRTLVYGGLTAILGLAYLGIVVILQQVLAPITLESDVAIAASTLAVAALFRPLRARIQTFIDRRFYRRKYDAAATLSEFSSRLRDEVDLESLGHELVDVVSTTMQPAQASLWLRRTEVRS